MLNLKMYNGKDLQLFLSMLNQCEDTGVTDITHIRDKIYKYINKDLLEKRTRYEGFKEMRRSSVKKNNREQCPECSRGFLSPVINGDGLKILGCGVCRYSKVVSSKEA